MAEPVRDKSIVRSWWPVTRAVIVGAFLVAVMTAPTVQHLTTVGRLDSNDGRFSIWNVAWIDHAILTDPRDLLNANIFWPHTGTLAYSELNLVAGVLGLPWYAATGSALAALNGAIASGLLLAFVCMWALVRRLSGSDAAGFVSAVGFTFCPYVTAHTPHVQLLMIFVFPLMMLSFHRLADRPSPGAGLALGATLVVAGLASGYYGIYGGCAVALLSLLYARRARAYWMALGTAIVALGVLLYPIYWRFARARAASGAGMGPRGLLPSWSANVSAYLASNAIAHTWWLLPLQHWQTWNDVLFPGIGTLVLAGIGVACARRSADWRTAWRYLVLAAVAAWASFGPPLYLYTVLNVIVPGMSLLRAPARLGIVVTFALAVIAGLGAAALQRRWRPAPLLLTAILACELGVSTPMWGWPSWPLQNALPVSEAYRMLAHLPRAPLVEFPFSYAPSDYPNHTKAMFWSTYHWQPLVNGYSDLRPPDFDDIALPINFFPDPASFEIMRQRRVRYVLWHVDEYGDAFTKVIADRLAKYASDLHPIVKTNDIWLYEIVAWPQSGPS